MNGITLDPTTWKVLVIDDEQDNLNVMSMVLQLWKSEVTTAKGGAEGLTLLPNRPFNIVLLDISMPLMDGWTVLQAIRASPQFGNIAVIALTAHAMLGDKELGLQAGFDAYITKPFNFKTLQHEIKMCVKQVYRLEDPS